MPIPFVTVDALTSVKYRGNPAAVVMLPARVEQSHGTDGFPTDAFLIDVAKEMNLSETAFVKPRADAAAADDASAHPLDGDAGFAEYDLRWFTRSGTEVDLCGHATLATAHALWSTGAAALTRALRFHTRSGPLAVVPLGGGLIELDVPCAPPLMSLIPDPSTPQGEEDASSDERRRVSVTAENVAAALNLPQSAAGGGGFIHCILHSPYSSDEL